ncbi:MAG: response regulator transcription factor [Clostridiales bacterium]|nr:response regulator transcription factor [Clostridiales bacterium]MCF8022571.1 response regulator transcription factor [Clostridiales bacterium]
MYKIRLLIVSEDSSAGQGLETIFSTENVFDIIGCCSFEEAKEKAISVQPDVVLLNVYDSFQNCNEKIKEIKNGCPCSLLFALVGEKVESLAEAITNGLDCCLPRNIRRRCIVKAVELAYRAGIFCMPGSFKSLVSFLGTKTSQSESQVKNKMPDAARSLTRREIEILQLMAKNYPNRKIAGELFISEPTVKAHVSSILRKLNQETRSQAIIYSYKIGLVDEAKTTSDGINTY